MNAAHFHLILVHVPVIMIPLGALLLAWGIWKGNPSLRGAGNLFFVGSALFTVAAFLLGEGAEEIVEEIAGISKKAMEAHEEAAELALWFAVALGVLSLGVLLASKFTIQIGLRSQGLVLLLSLVTASILGYSAQLGGRIRHPEAFQANQGEKVQEHAQEQDD